MAKPAKKQTIYSLEDYISLRAKNRNRITLVIPFTSRYTFAKIPYLNIQTEFFIDKLPSLAEQKIIPIRKAALEEILSPYKSVFELYGVFWFFNNSTHTSIFWYGEELYLDSRDFRYCKYTDKRLYICTKDSNYYRLETDREGKKCTYMLICSSSEPFELEYKNGTCTTKLKEKIHTIFEDGKFVPCTLQHEKIPQNKETLDDLLVNELHTVKREIKRLIADLYVNMRDSDI
jgi:hypothetical protein